MASSARLVPAISGHFLQVSPARDVEEVEDFVSPPEAAGREEGDSTGGCPHHKYSACDKNVGPNEESELDIVFSGIRGCFVCLSGRRWL